MHKGFCSEAARILEQSEATVRKRSDLPIAEILPDNTKLFDLDAVKHIATAKCLGESASLDARTLVRKFVAVMGKATRDQLDRLVRAFPNAYDIADENDKGQLRQALAELLVDLQRDRR
jgi:hypothetical protein